MAVSASQFQLVPRATFGAGQLEGQQIRAGNQAFERQAVADKTAVRAGQFSTQALSGDDQALQSLAGIDVKQAQNIQSFLSTQSEEQRAETLRENESLTRSALIAKTLPPEQVRPFLERQRQKAIAEGRSTARVDRALAGTDQQLLQDIEVQATEGQKISDVAKRLFPTQTPTSLQKDLIAGGLKPGTPEFQAAVIKGRPSTSITIGGEKKEQEELAKIRVSQLGRFQEERETAIDTNQSLDVLENIDVNTGALEPFKQAMASFGKAFGLDTSRLANVSGGESFNAEAKRLILAVKASQKGPQTDKDENTIAETVANLGNTPEGNTFIMNSARALNNRRIERADFFEEFLEGKGTLKGSNRAWSKFKRETPMVSAHQRTAEGLPVFFYKFADNVREATVAAGKEKPSNELILRAWRLREKDAKALKKGAK